MAKTLISKPPVVTIMGHVDHGKTTLLDAIRKSKITQGEHGGITQHIGAYQVSHQGKKITFIDTPGHAAFTKMRARGAKATDLVILVVAANDGVKPQTKESLAHIRQAKAPFLVAISKTDLPDSDLTMVKSQLAKEDVLVEDFGGQVVCVEISATKKQGLDQLLEMLILMAEMKELKSDPKAPFQAVIIEAKLDHQKGPLVSVIGQEGGLTVGDFIIAGKNPAKVRAIFNDNGEKINKIGPGDPGQILGFKTLPKVGLLVKKTKHLMVDKKEPKELKKPYQKITKKDLAKKESDNNKAEVKVKIKLILKADTYGTLEAIKNNIAQEIEVVYAQTGEVNESDILLAQAAGAQIIIFNLKLSPEMKKFADKESVMIRPYNIIYKLLEDIEKRVLEWLEPEINEEIHGEGVVIAEFNMHKTHICGCKLEKGFFTKNHFYRIKRDKDLIAENLRVKSLQKEKQTVDKVKAGNEVGLVFRPNVDFLIKDAIIAYSKIK